jgi:CHAT domain-containing protein
MLSVPARFDSPTTVDAFRQAVRTFKEDAARLGVIPDLREGPSADPDAVRDVLTHNDIVTFLCHGLIDPDQRELALLVARNGDLPTQHPIAAASREGRAHRITWRALQDLDRGPALILSGACSTGQGLVAGMGERLGLFGALRSTGTRAVVAPAWDAVAADVPQQLGHIHNLVLAGYPLAVAVRAASDTYASLLPAWRSRVLSIEGDWR